MDLKQAHKEILTRDLPSLLSLELRKIEGLQINEIEVLGFFIVPPHLLQLLSQSSKLTQSTFSVVHVYYIKSLNNYYCFITNSFDDGDEITDVLAIENVGQDKVPFLIDYEKRIIDLIKTFPNVPLDLSEAIKKQKYNFEDMGDFPAPINVQEYAVAGWRRRYKPNGSQLNNSLGKLIRYFEGRSLYLLRDQYIYTSNTRYIVITDYLMTELAGFMEIAQ